MPGQNEPSDLVIGHVKALDNNPPDSKASDIKFYGDKIAKLQTELLTKTSKKLGLSREDLEDIFIYHAPESDQIPKYKAIRDAALVFALVILNETPSCPDQTVAIRKIRESVMVANQSIALKGKY